MSVTTAGLAPAPTEHLLDDVRLAVLTQGTPARWDFTDGVLEVHGEGELEIRLSVPLGDAVGFWHPACDWNRTLVADWAGYARVSLVSGAAAGCLYDSTGRTLLAYAAADPVPEVSMRFGVSEEHKTFVVHLTIPAADRTAEPYRIVFTPSAVSVATAMRALRRALGGGQALVSEAAREPVYSTWYGFNQDVSDEGVEAEAALAAELGFGTLILDDGWQELGHGRGYLGVGDWRPDLTKFPDFGGHVGRVRATGMKYLAWVAPLLLGPESACFAELSAYAPALAGAPGARVLDPRRPEVRRHVAELCARLMTDYGLDGLKIDFLDEVMVYAGRPAQGADITDVGAAMRVLLDDIRAAIGPDALIELRQPYIGPGMAGFGDLLRANDCPADATANRIRTIDVGLLAIGGAVHSDMLMWDPEGSVHSAARQVIGALHSVPQISAKLGELPERHRQMVAFWLARWRELRPLLLDGEVEPGRPDELYPVITASHDGECVITVSAERVVPVDLVAHRRSTVINGTGSGTLVLDIEGVGAICVFDADGSRIEPTALRLGPGLCTLSVPPSGLAVLEVAQ